MIKVFGYLKRKPGLSPQEFADYYEHNHVPLVLSKAELHRSTRNASLRGGRALQRGLSAAPQRARRSGCDQRSALGGPNHVVRASTSPS